MPCLSNCSTSHIFVLSTTLGLLLTHRTVFRNGQWMCSGPSDSPSTSYGSFCIMPYFIFCAFFFFSFQKTFFIVTLYFWQVRGISGTTERKHDPVSWELQSHLTRDSYATLASNLGWNHKGLGSLRWVSCLLELLFPKQLARKLLKSVV